MSESPRYPIDILQRLRPPAPVKLGGRVVSLDGATATIEDITGSVSVECDVPPPIGAWVVASGEWNGVAVVGHCDVLTAPAGAFPKTEGDWTAFQDGGARRMERLRARARARRAVRDFFDDRAFLEVETPAAVPSPGLDLHLDAFPIAGEHPPRWLITSPEYQMKRLLAGGAPRIYQLARCWRRGELGALHEPEFTMLEWYRAFAGSDEVMRDTEHLVAHVARTMLDGSTVIPGRGSPIDVAPPWQRMTVDEAFRTFANVAVADVLPDEERFFRILVDQVEPQLGRMRPIFLTHWPASMASLARLHQGDPSTCDRFEAYVAGIELCNGFGELVDPVEQRRRFEADQRRREAEGKIAYPIDERFIGALEEGVPPSGGNALGFDRLVMLLLGAESIGDVMAFPSERL